MRLRGVLIGVLSIALLIQLGVSQFQGVSGRHAHDVTSQVGGRMLGATWAFHPRTLHEARDKASLIVLARVSAVQQAPDIIIPLQGLPPEEAARHPNQRITFEVQQTLRGTAQGTIRLFYLGDETLFVEDDPPYQVGETYVLFVEPKLDEPGTYLVISPEGRYQVVNDRLEPIAAEGFAAAFHGKPVTNLVQALATAASGQQQ